MRWHLCTERTKRDQERCAGGHPTKQEPSQILFHLQQLVVVWSKEKNLSICLATNSIDKQSAFKEFMRGCIKCLFKIQYDCVNLSSIVQDFSPIIFITVVNWVSQLHVCSFLNACCLSDRSLYSWRWAMIFERTMCSSNFQGIQVKETGR